MSYDINQVFLIGRLTRDPETRFSASTAICKFSIANNSGKDEKSVSYFDIVAFGKTAETCQQYLKKGSQIAISGRLSQNRWEQEGQKRSKIEIICQNVQFIGGKVESGNNFNYDSNKVESSYNNDSDFDDVLEEDEDIPF